MAAVASTDVTLVSQYTQGDRYGTRIEEVKIYDVVLSSNGGTTLDIPAALFGMTTINWAMCVRTLVSTTLATVAVMVEAGGVGILVADPENATDGTRGNAGNYTGTLRVRLGGV